MSDPAPTLEQVAAQNLKLMAELIEVMNGIDHFSDALNFRNDHLSKALRDWISAGSSILSKLGLQGAELRADDWKMVPPEPTDEMIAAAKATTSAALTKAHATEIYLGMLAAAPSQY